MSDIEIWADGASCGNSLGPGGWCALLKSDGMPIHIAYGGEPKTTNNIMELVAAMRGLQMLAVCISTGELPGKHTITIISDSEYVTKAYSDGRIFKWADKNFKEKGVDRPNAEIWREMWIITKIINSMGYHILAKHVDGHSGIAENEFCDSVARDIKERLKRGMVGNGTSGDGDELNAHKLLRHVREAIGVLHNGD